MKIITQRDVIRSLPERWAETMIRVGTDTYGGGGDMRSRSGVLEQLRALDLETVTPQEIAQIIGNGSWTRLEPCHECGEMDCKVVVRVGQEPDYGSATAYVCPACLVRIADEVKKILS